MNDDKSFPTPADFADALAVQSACNLSGVVFSFARVMQRICNEAHAKGYGTEWKNRHPIVRMYTQQIAHLSCAGLLLDDEANPYSKAYAECEARSKEQVTA